MSNPYGQDPYGQPPTHQPYGQPAYPQAAGQPPYGGQSPWGPPVAYASWGRRVGASLVDGVVPLVLYAVGIGVSLGTAETTQQTRVDAFGTVRVEEVLEPTGTGLAVLGVCYLLGIVFAIWNQWIRQGRTGYSLGKQALGIKLVKDGTDLPPGIGLNIGRGFAHVLDAIPLYLGFLWPLFDAKRRTWADMICSTTVVLRPKA